MRRTYLKTAVIAAVLICGLIYAGSWALFATSPFKPGSSISTVILIHKGLGPAEIARALESDGIIADRQRFLALGRALREWKRIKAGEYKFSPAMTPLE